MLAFKFCFEKLIVGLQRNILDDAMTELLELDLKLFDLSTVHLFLAQLFSLFPRSVLRPAILKLLYHRHALSRGFVVLLFRLFLFHNGQPQLIDYFWTEIGRVGWLMHPVELGVADTAFPRHTSRRVLSSLLSRICRVD